MGRPTCGGDPLERLGDGVGMDESAVDGDGATLQVDVVPAQAEDLVAAHAGDRG